MKKLLLLAAMPAAICAADLSRLSFERASADTPLDNPHANWDLDRIRYEISQKEDLGNFVKSVKAQSLVCLQTLQKMHFALEEGKSLTSVEKDLYSTTEEMGRQIALLTQRIVQQEILVAQYRLLEQKDLNARLEDRKRNPIILFRDMPEEKRIKRSFSKEEQEEIDSSIEKAKAVFGYRAEESTDNNGKTYPVVSFSGDPY